MEAKNMDWTVLDSEYISNHIYFTARRDRCRKPDGQIVPEYFVVELPPSVCILPVTTNNEVVMIRQYRHPLRHTILEIPGGFVDPNEDYVEAAKRELLEETGYAFDAIAPLGRTAANPGLLDNYTSLYVATGGKKVQEQDLDENEDIEIILMPLEKIKGMLLRHELVQSMHTCCLFYALLHMGHLKIT